jgi:hypothetical protein
MSRRTKERLQLHAPVDTSQSLGLLSPAPAEASKVELSLPNFSWNATERIVPVWPFRGALMVPVPTLKYREKKGRKVNREAIMLTTEHISSRTFSRKTG